LQANWQISAIPAYDIVFTPRRANIDDLRALGCPAVHYLPFGYDEALFGHSVASSDAASLDVLFVGGADRDRVAFMKEFLQSGLRVGLAGGYWDRFAETRAHALGVKAPPELSTMTASAKLNLCLVRRANRDGHVMRSFEIAAAGGCMLTEDTDEHREIFGADGESVVYFRDAREAAQRASWLLAQPAERARLGRAVRARVGVPENSYRARLVTMLEVASNLRAGASAIRSVASSQC
jgi:spore maturation protein CgeB